MPAPGRMLCDEAEEIGQEAPGGLIEGGMMGDDSGRLVRLRLPRPAAAKMPDDHLECRRFATEARAGLPSGRIEVNVRLHEIGEGWEERTLAIGRDAEEAAGSEPRHQSRIHVIPGSGN